MNETVKYFHQWRKGWIAGASEQQLDNFSLQSSAFQHGYQEGRNSLRAASDDERVRLGLSVAEIHKVV